MRILLVAPTTPSDTSSGAAQRTSLVYRALLEHGKVDVIVVKEGQQFSAKKGDRTGEISDLTVRASAWYAKYQPDPDIKQWARRCLSTNGYDLVVARELSTAGRFQAVLGAPVIADADDAYYRYAPSGAGLAAHVFSAVRTAARRVATRRALHRFAHVWLACERDRQRFPGISSNVLPNVAPDVAEQPPSAIEPPTILFVGALWYGPNIDAVNWFIAKCWPAIRRTIPRVRLRIVGGGPISQRAAWSRAEGVQCTGFVADLAAEYRVARFTIAPIRFGGGTQVKTLEALAYGRAAIVSSFVSEGYSGTLRTGESLLVADSAEEMVACCLRLLRHPEDAVRMARAGREVVLERFSWPVFRAAVAEGMSRIPVTTRQGEPTIG